MDLALALGMARANHQSVLTTLRRDGRPQLSNVLHTVDDAGIIRVSTTADRAKYANLTRRPWAAVKVDGPNFWSYAVLEGDVDLTPVATAANDPTVAELVELYRALSGEHDDWAGYRQAMVDDRRLVVRLRPSYAYGMARS